MPCYVCDPKCQICKSQMRTIAICPACNKASFNRNIIDSKCPRCGAIIEVKKPVEALCQYSGKMCSDMCGKQNKTPKDGVIGICKRNPNPILGL